MADFPLTLSYSYFGAPGCGGSTTLSISVDDRGNMSVDDDLPSEYCDPDETDATSDPDVRPCAGEFRRNAVLPASRGWRGVIDYLATNEIVAFFTDGDIRGEYPWPDSMDMEGAGSVASDLIAAAWSGSPLLDIVQALAQLPDTLLEALRVRCGSLCGRAVLQPLLRIWNHAQELDVPFEVIVGRAHRFDFHLPSMLRDVRALSAVLSAEASASARRRAWTISPYAPAIDLIVGHWRRAHPATSTNTQIGQGMRAGALKRFLEAYAIEHGQLPNGVHRVDGGPASAFDVDFSALVGKG